MGQVLTDRRSNAANSVSGNVLAGKIGEFLARPSVVRLYGTGAAIGLNLSFLIGREVFSQDEEISAANRFPIIPDDFVVDGVGGAGERIFVELRNTTGGAIISNIRLDIIEVQ